MIMASLHWIWRCWVYIIFRFMQIVINNSSSMKPLHVLNNLIYTKIIPCPVLNVFNNTKIWYGKGAGKFFRKTVFSSHLDSIR